MGRELCHARMVDAEFLLEKGDFAAGTVTFGFQSHTGVGTIGCPAPGITHGAIGPS